MSQITSARLQQIARSIRNLSTNIKVPNTFTGKVSEIDKLLENDQTGLVRTLLDFMVGAGTVPMHFETSNDTMNSVLLDWQTNHLNTDVNLDIPSGLEALSEQYFRERWRSSFLGLRVIFDTVDMGASGSFQLPTKMWFVDGGALTVKNDSSSLNNKKYFIQMNKEKETPFTSSGNSLAIIRKPYNLWHQDMPSPYLANRGVLFNAMLKNAIVEKQAQLIEALIPYILKLSSGSDQLARMKMLPTETELKALKQQILDKLEDCHDQSDVKNLITAFSYDTNLEHIIPDLTKALDPNILVSVDKNILVAMGMVEVEGFTDNRKDAALNPKVLITEVQDAVKDWAELIKTVMLETMKRNKDAHPKLTSNMVTVRHGVIKTFLDDKTIDCIKTLSSRGLISIQDSIESTTPLDANVQAELRSREEKNGWNDLFFPRVLQNTGDNDPNNQPDPEKVDRTLDDRIPGTPEADEFNEGKGKNKKKKRTSVYSETEKIVKDILPLEAQKIWVDAYEQASKIVHDASKLENIAWARVKETYAKVPNEKVWQKIV